VLYDANDLWDNPISHTLPCFKTPQLFEFKVAPELSSTGVEIKKEGGFLFFGGQLYIELSLKPNFAPPFKRRSEDVDWLRKCLSEKYPGAYISPLGVTPSLSEENKEVAAERAKEVLVFLNSLLRDELLMNNKFSYTFMTEGSYELFKKFKGKYIEVKPITTIEELENMEGSISIEISQEILELIKSSNQYSKEVFPIYRNLQYHF
jgi:hypothetical protein